MQLHKKICILMASLLAMEHAGAQLLGFRSYKLEEDNQPFKINTLFKNSQGYLYAGTSNGLYAFDGLKFKPVKVERTQQTDTVTALYEDKDRVLWAGFKNGRIAKKTGSILQYFEPEEGTPKVPITAFLQDRENNLWFATNGEGIYHFSNGHLYLIDTAEGLSDLHIHALAMADNGDVLAASDQGINICSPSGTKSKIRVIGPKNGLPDYYVTSIIPAGNNRFWIGLQDKGFCQYDHSSGMIIPAKPDSAWKFGQINSLLYSQNILWIGTEESGLLMQNRPDQQVVAARLGTPLTGKLNNLLQDNEGNIWFNTPAELVSTAGNRLKLLPLFNKTGFEAIHAILCDHQGNYWVSAKGGLVKYVSVNGSFVSKPYPISGLNPKTDITALVQDPWHNIWISTMGSGILVLDPSTGRSRKLDENPLLKNASILGLTANGRTICAGGLEGAAILFTLNDGNSTIDGKYPFTNYSNITNIGNNYIYCVFRDSRGRTWFGTDGKGITVMDNGRFTHYGKENGIRDEHVLSFAEDPKGRIWFNTESEGIYSYDGRVFRNYSIANGLNSSRITTLKTDPLGKIVIVYEKGLDILNPETGSVSTLNSAQGLEEVSTDAGAVTTDTSGNIALCTAGGIVVYAPVANTTNHVKTIIENVQLFLNDVELGKKGDFKYDENSFTFYFTGIYYTNPGEIRYQYKLDGLDTAWIPTRDRNVSFLKLQPGKYKFHIRSSLSESYAGADEAVYEFVIESPLWKRFWFIALCILTGGALIYGYIKSREKQLNKMQTLQREKIEFQFQVLRNQINPHFLFNSFNTLISAIEDNPKMAVSYVEHLSEFFRNIVNYRDKDVITLGEDIGLMQTYFYLQQKRYGDNLKMNINVPEESKTRTYIPPLTLQLLLENAIKHNAISKETPLSVDLFTKDGKWLVMRNNLNPKITREPVSGMGMQNIVSRYNLLSGEAVEVVNNGKDFTVSLPMLKQQ